MIRYRISFVLLLASSILLVHNSFSQDILSKKQWLEDLASLEKAVYEKHVNPFWKRPGAEFENLFAIVRNKISGTSETQLKPEIIMTDFAKILALTGDGHSGVSAKSRAELFGLYNYNLSMFPEGIYIVRTDDKNKAILGSRVIKIDDTPIEEAKKIIRSVSTSFHEQGFKRFSPRYFESPAVLFGLGIAKDPQKLTLTLQKENGLTSTIEFQRVTAKEQEKTKFVSLNDLSANTVPYYRQSRGKSYWFEYLPDKKMVYLNYLSMRDAKEDPMQDFVKRLSASIEKVEVEKFVIDLRSNPGGDQFTAWPLLSFILSDKKFNQPGKLFAITGPTTFSAASAFLQALETKTNCIIAGTGTCDSPVYPAEDNTVVLPNCKMEVRLSSEMWSYSFDDDDRTSIEPDIQVVTSFTDYMEGRDPVLEKILTYTFVSKKTNTIDSEKFAGRYLFGIDKTLEITASNGSLRADVRGRLHTELIPVTENKFETCIKDLFFEFSGNEMIMHLPAGSKKNLRKLAHDELTALDYVLTKQFDKADKAYRELKQQFPANLSINGANLAGLSLYLLTETKDFDMGIGLLEIAIKLDPNSAVAKNLLKGIKSFRSNN